MKKRYILLTAMVVLYGVCAGLIYAACNSEVHEVNYDLDPSITGEQLVAIGTTHAYTCTVAEVMGVDGLFTPTASIAWSGGDTPSEGSGDEFTTTWNTAGSNTLTALVDGTDTDTNILTTIECTNITEHAVTVVKIASAVADPNVICYRNHSTVTGVPNPLPSFPPDNAVWTNLSSNGGIDPGTGATTIYTPSMPSTNNNDIEIKGECGTSSESAFITAVGVTGMTFTVVGAGADTPADTLGFEDVGLATAIVSPTNRALEWSWAPETVVDDAQPILVSLTPTNETLSANVAVLSGSGSGTIRIVAVDSDTGCGWYKIITIGCGGCSAGLCPAFGSAAIEVHSVSARFSLGSGYRGSSAGFLHINTTELAPELFSPSVDSLPPSEGPVHSEDCLAHEEGPGSHSTASADFLTSSGDDKLLRQIKVPDGLVDIVVSNEFRYDMAFYPISAVGTKDQDGYYQPTGAPSVSYIIENPDASTNVYNRLRISKVIGSDTNVSEYVNTVDGGTNTWKLATGNGLKTESVTEFSDGTYTNILRTVTGTSNEVVSAVLTKSMEFPWGLARVEQVTDPDGVALSTSWSYYTNSADAGRYSRIAMQVNPDGSWQKSDYNASGYPSVQIRGFKDTPTNATAAEARATYYDYTLHNGETPGYRPSTARTVIENTLGITNSITYRAYTMNGSGEREEITERAYSPDASYGDTNNQRTVSTYYADDADEYCAGKLKSQERPDGTLTSYTYENGLLSITDAATGEYSFTAGGTNEYLRTTVTRGTMASPAGIAGETTREVTITAPLGGTLVSESQVYTGSGFERIRWRMNVLDESHRPVAVYNSDGTQSSTTWGCCGKESETDQSGLQTTYMYDALKRVEFMTRQLGTNTIFTTYSYDAAGRRLSTLTEAGTLSQSTSNAYNTAGQLVESVDQQGIATTYAYSTNGLENTTIRAGLTNTTVRYADGRTHYTEQNGTRKQTYTYGINADGTQWSQVFTGPDATNSPAWQRTTTDMLGRTIKTERPGFGGTTLITENEYNAAGQLIRTGEKSFAPDAQEPTLLRQTLYAYNALGQQTLTAQDINTNGVIDLAGPDRVSERHTSYQSHSSHWWRVSTSLIYPEDGSATPLTNSIQRQRLTGLGQPSDHGILTAETISTDLRGNQTTQQTHIDRPNAVRVGLVSTPTSTNDQTQITINGLLTEQTSSTGQKTTYGYDALGRRISTIVRAGLVSAPSRQTAQFTHYNTKGQVDWVEDAATNRTTFAYDPDTGRRISTTDALTNTTHQAYNAEGQLIATWGATYPVAYEYDDFDRMSAMYTYRGTNEITNAEQLFTLPTDRTTWSYDQSTGLLTNKLYAADENGIRNGTSYTYTPDGKLATRTWARGVTTTYSYDTCCGALTNITYSDNTPTITYTYDRIGRQTSARTGEKSFARFAYDPQTLALTNETVIANGTTNHITRTQDTYGRAAGYSLASGGTAASLSVEYEYDTVGRFHSVSSQSPGGTAASLSAEYTYLPNSSLISGYTQTPGGTAPTLSVTRTYEPNRNLITDIENTVRVGLVSTPISTFAYHNDAIGRRTKRVDNASITNNFGYNTRSEVIEALMGTNTYNYDYDPIGNRLSAASFVHSVSSVVDYASNPLNQYTNIQGGAAASLPAYDADGNMVSYNDWTFTWNGENRLIKAEYGQSLVVAHAYDHMGRRIQKITGGTAASPSTNTFLYDGWNLIKETGGTAASPSVTHYVWGLDLSGSMQGAGGIGGLLYVHKTDPSDPSNPSAYSPAYDANGNITEYVDLTNGTTVAHYEYDAFGNTTQRSGSEASNFPHRFSTKYLDEETGWYYYGRRYYSPELGRWVNRDPIGEMGGVNIYEFVINSPLSYFDLIGLSSPLIRLREEDATPTMCAIVALLMDVWAIGQNQTLWDHYKNGGGESIDNASIDWFDPNSTLRDTYINAALYRGLTQAAGASCSDSGSFQWPTDGSFGTAGHNIPTTYMIWNFDFHWQCDVDWNAKWDSACCECDQWEASASCKFKADDTVNFWPDDSHFPLPPYDVDDRFIRKCNLGQGFKVESEEVTGNGRVKTECDLDLIDALLPQ